MARKPVNERQLEVLRWIADGCPEGVWEDFTYKTTAIALQGRHSAKVSKRGGWHAEITDDGRYHLQHGEYPGEPPREARPRQAPLARPAPAEQAAAEPDEPETLSSELKEAPSPPSPGVRVPAALRNPHPVIAALRDDRRRLGLTRSVRGRTLRVLQAIVTEAEHRGWSVREVRLHQNEYGYSWLDSRDHLVIDTGETSVGLRVLQRTDRSPHVPTADELDQQRRWGASPPKYEHTPNDYLRIEIDSRWDGRQHMWSEGKRGPIDQRLPAIFGEIELRHVEARERRLMARRIEEEREQRRLEAVEQAKVQLRESHRAEALAKQVTDWRHARELREYAEAMERQAAGLEGDARREAEEWIRWALGHAGAVDPLSRPLRMPADPETASEVLAERMRQSACRGVSPA